MRSIDHGRDNVSPQEAKGRGKAPKETTDYRIWWRAPTKEGVFQSGKEERVKKTSLVHRRRQVTVRPGNGKGSLSKQAQVFDRQHSTSGKYCR
mgnify:CR=1 FL=1